MFKFSLIVLAWRIIVINLFIVYQLIDSARFDFTIQLSFLQSIDENVLPINIQVLLPRKVNNRKALLIAQARSIRCFYPREGRTIVEH